MNKKQLNYNSFIDNPEDKHIRRDIIKDPEQFLNKKISDDTFSFGAMNIFSYGLYKEIGFVYNFKPFLKHYVYKQYDSWQECYALNEKNLKKLVDGKINIIKEL